VSVSPGRTVGEQTLGKDGLAIDVSNNNSNATAPAQVDDSPRVTRRAGEVTHAACGVACVRAVAVAAHRDGPGAGERGEC
jgi:hypothetical protein